MSREYVRKTEVISTTPAPLEAFLYDDFESGVKFLLVPDAGGMWYRTPEKKLQGGYSFRSYNSLPLLGGYNDIYWLFGISFARFVRMHLSVCGSAGFSFPTLEITLTLYCLGRLLQPTLRINATTHQVEIKRDGGVWVTLDMAPIIGLADHWQKIELVIDLFKKKYQRVNISAMEEDISQYKLFDNGAAGDNVGGGLNVRHENATAFASDMFLDQIFIGPTPAF